MASAVLLQGCTKEKLPWMKEGAEEPKAECNGKTFTCSGPQDWCAEQEKKCTIQDELSEDRSSCHPKCTWECETKACEQECTPKCNEALCTTRCPGADASKCKMNCKKPKCVVICPKTQCAGKECAKCTTKCNEPKCDMECETPTCKHVCAEPQCNWECKNPKTCAKPKCKLTCGKPACSAPSCACSSGAPPQMVKNLPPLQPGETEVTSALAPPEKKNKAALL